MATTKITEQIINLNQKPVDFCNVFIWQDTISSTHFDARYHHMIREFKPQKERIDNLDFAENRVNNALNKVNVLEQKMGITINLIVMPELSVPDSMMKMIQAWSSEHPKTLIIAGSHYRRCSPNAKKHHHVSPVFFKGDRPIWIYKNILGPKEKDVADFIGESNKIIDLINTPAGKIRVVICSDFIVHKYTAKMINLENDNKKKPDFIIPIACQMKPEGEKRHYGYADEVCSKMRCNPFVIFANSLCYNKYASGNSAVFGPMYEEERIELNAILPYKRDHNSVQCKKFIAAMPDYSRYMVVKCRLKNRENTSQRGVQDKPLAQITFVEGLSRYKALDEHDIKLVVFDLDGTLIQGAYHYSWAVIYEALKIPETQRKMHKEKYLQKMNPTFDDYKIWCHECLEDLKKYKVTRAKLDEIVKEHTHPTKNLGETLKELLRREIRIAIISGGIDVFARVGLRDAYSLFDPEDIFINRLTYSDNGVLDGIKPTKFDFAGKAAGIDYLCSKYDIPRRRVAFVGDARNDQQALTHAGLGIAFYPILFSVTARCHITHESEILDSLATKNHSTEDKTSLNQRKDLWRIIEPITNYGQNPRY